MGMTLTKRKAFFLACLLAYSIIMLRLVADALGNPYYNWDIFGYVGCVIAWSGAKVAAVYTQSLAILKNELPDYIFMQHIKSALCINDRAFWQQLPIYQVKPLYNACMWLLYHAGMKLTTASYVVSVTSFGLLAALLAYWKPRYLAREVWLLLVYVITFHMPGAMEILPKLSTPDALGTLLGVAAIYSWLTHRSVFQFTLLSLLAQLARPDAVILCGACTVYFALFAPAEWKMEKKAALMSLTLYAAAYIAVYYAAGGYSYERFFIYSFLQRSSYPADSKLHLHFGEYWTILRYGTSVFLQLPRTIAMLSLSVAAIACYALKPQAGGKMYLHLLLVCWAALAVRFALYPSPLDHRYYFSYFLIILYCGGEVIAAYLGALMKKPHGIQPKNVVTNG